MAITDTYPPDVFALVPMSQLSKQHFDTAWKAAGRKSVHRWLR